MTWLVMGWRVPRNPLEEWKEERQLDRLARQARSDVTAVMGKQGRKYLVCALVEPADLGTLVEWKRGLLHYRLYSRLSPEEALRVLESLPYCGALNPEPTVTPAVTCAP